MKRYESLITAALVTVLLAMLAPTTCCLGAQVGGGGSELRVSRPRPRSHSQMPRRPHHQLLPRMKCEGEKTYYVLNRGDCRSDSNRRAGYVTVWSSRTRFQVVAQQTGLNGSHPLAAIVKETCRAVDNSRLAQIPAPVVRYRHNQSNRYICFDKNGKVRAWSKLRANRRGRRCMFQEIRVDKTSFHTIRSYHTSKWHLSFNQQHPKPHPVRYDDKAGMPRHGADSRAHKCETQFYSAEATAKASSADGPSKFSQIFNEILKDHNSTRRGENKQQRQQENLLTALAAYKAATVVQDKERKTQSSQPVQTPKSSSTVLQTTKSSTPAVSPTPTRLLSSAQLEALKLKRVLWEAKKRRYKIRHATHKQPRPSRRHKNLVKKRAKAALAVAKRRNRLDSLS